VCVVCSVTELVSSVYCVVCECECVWLTAACRPSYVVYDMNMILNIYMHR
jgi:hypothetical protein